MQAAVELARAFPCVHVVSGAAQTQLRDVFVKHDIANAFCSINGSGAPPPSPPCGARVLLCSGACAFSVSASAALSAIRAHELRHRYRCTGEELDGGGKKPVHVARMLAETGVAPAVRRCLVFCYLAVSGRAVSIRWSARCIFSLIFALRDL